MNGEWKNISVKDGTGEHGRGREGGKLRTTPRRKEDSDWMHDLGGKNRFSKLSYVERTAAALSARRQTIPPFPSLSPSFTSSTQASNSESGDTMTTSGSGKGSEYTVQENLSVSFTVRYFRVQPYKQKGGRKLYRVYIARWTSTTLFVRDWDAHWQSFFHGFFYWPASSATQGKRIQAEFPDGELPPRIPVVLGIRGSFSVIPVPIPFLYVYCSSSHCTSYERIRETKVSNELPDQKLPSVWSANRWYLNKCLS